MALCSLLYSPNPSHTTVLQTHEVDWFVCWKSRMWNIHPQYKKTASQRIEGVIRCVKKHSDWSVLRSCSDWPVVSSQPVQSDVSSRELTLIRSDQGAGDVELDRIFMMHCVTHNIPIGTSWRIPLHLHLKQLTSLKKQNKKCCICWTFTWKIQK